ncbi:hypothetical protein CDD83_694 [Cordyceps sp. RAO-2017]|nr:hypothetical protein CDD83_694 [Cordyceps sp. RAO-2017]
MKYFILLIIAAVAAVWARPRNADGSKGIRSLDDVGHKSSSGVKFKPTGDVDPVNPFGIVKSTPPPEDVPQILYQPDNEPDFNSDDESY